MITSLLTSSIFLAAPLLAGGTDAPPVCNAGGPYFAECQGAQTIIQLDGTGSFDPEGTALTFKWISECPMVTFSNTTSATPMAIITHTPGTPVCAESCIGNVGLEVTSGGQKSACSFDITVDDTLPPVITCPPDLTAVWGIDEDPSNTGYATALDVCDPAPVVTYVDTRVPAQICSGLEEWVVRDWTAVDACGNTSTCTQTITLLSPAGGCSGAGTANLEIDPSSCVNLFDPSVTTGLFSVAVMGKGPFSVDMIDKSSIQLIRSDVAMANVNALRPWTAREADWIKAISYNQFQCSPFGKDGMNELAFRFRRKQVIKKLGLDLLPSGTKVPVAVTGFLKDGSAFWAADILTIQ